MKITFLPRAYELGMCIAVCSAGSTRPPGEYMAFSHRALEEPGNEMRVIELTAGTLDSHTTTSEIFCDSLIDWLNYHNSQVKVGRSMMVEATP
jgi:hypothetical protein